MAGTGHTRDLRIAGARAMAGTVQAPGDGRNQEDGRDQGMVGTKKTAGTREWQGPEDGKDLGIAIPGDGWQGPGHCRYLGMSVTGLTWGQQCCAALATEKSNARGELEKCHFWPFCC